MKKSIFIFILAILVLGGAFAFDLSAGLGGNFTINLDSLRYNGELITRNRTLGGGFFAFFEASYVEVNIGMLFGGIRTKIPALKNEYSDDKINVSYLTLGLLGKYPIYLGGITFFPIFGIQSDFGLSIKYAGKKLSTDRKEIYDALSKFWLKFGAGADLNLSRSMFLRPIILYGFNFGSKENREAMKLMSSDAKSIYHGLDARVVLGIKF